MKVCIVSDSHDSRALLATAVHDAKVKGAEVVFHCGDVVAPTTLRCLPSIGLPVHVIHGNNVGDLVAMHYVMNMFPDIINYYGQDAVQYRGQTHLLSTLPSLRQSHGANRGL